MAASQELQALLLEKERALGRAHSELEERSKLLLKTKASCR